MKARVIQFCWRFNVSEAKIYGKLRSHACMHVHTKIFLFNCFSLTVAPICRPGQIQTYNVGRGETAKIQCDVMGIPSDINFMWKFNTSVSELLDMPSSIVTNDKTRSTIHFKPMTEHVIIIASLAIAHSSQLSFSLILMSMIF